MTPGGTDQSTDKLVALMGRNVTRERMDRERLQWEVPNLRKIQTASPTRASAQNVAGGAPYYMGGINLQRNQSSSFHKTVNMFASQSNMHGAESQDNNRTQAAYGMHNADVMQMVGGHTGRRNIWFRAAENFHTRGNAPSGRTTPEYWNGQWEGAGAGNQSGEASHIQRPTAQRSAASKYARIQRKKERREMIGAQAMGDVDGMPSPNTDTSGRKHQRTGAWELLGILPGKRIENGRSPGNALIREAVACAKTGTNVPKPGSGRRTLCR